MAFVDDLLSLLGINPATAEPQPAAVRSAARMINPAVPPQPPGAFPPVGSLITPYTGVDPRTAPPPLARPPGLPPQQLPLAPTVDVPQTAEVQPGFMSRIGSALAGIQDPIKLLTGSRDPTGIGRMISGAMAPLGGAAPVRAAPPAQPRRPITPTPTPRRAAPTGRRKAPPLPREKPPVEGRAADETDFMGALRNVRVPAGPEAQRISSPSAPRAVAPGGDNLLRIMLNQAQVDPNNRLQQLLLSRLLSSAGR